MKFAGMPSFGKEDIPASYPENFIINAQGGAEMMHRLVRFFGKYYLLLWNSSRS